MKAEEVHALVDRYCRGEITAEDYFAQIEEHAREMVAAEVADMRKRRKQ